MKTLFHVKLPTP